MYKRWAITSRGICQYVQLAVEETTTNDQSVIERRIVKNCGDTCAIRESIVLSHLIKQTFPVHEVHQFVMSGRQAADAGHNAAVHRSSTACCARPCWWCWWWQWRLWYE